MSDTETETARDDPLDGAAVGETRTVRKSKTLSGINFEPRAFYGSDRQGRPRIVNVEVVTDEHDDDVDDVRVTWEAEMTKCLPPRWDECDEPRTPKEARHERRSRWIGRVMGVISGMVPFVIAALIGLTTTNALADRSSNVEAVSITFSDLIILIGFVTAFVYVVYLGVQYAPGTAGRTR